MTRSTSDDLATPLAPRIRRIAADLVGIDESNFFDLDAMLGGRQLDELIEAATVVEPVGHVHRRQRLGGLLNYYRRAA